MSQTRRKPESVLPGIEQGEWRGELVASKNLQFGQVMQSAVTSHLVEFSYIVASQILHSPRGRTWPGALMVVAPNPMRPPSQDAGVLMKARQWPTLTLSLNLTRDQFSYMLRLFEANKLKELRFTLRKKSGVCDKYKAGVWVQRSLVKCEPGRV